MRGRITAASAMAAAKRAIDAKDGFGAASVSELSRAIKLARHTHPPWRNAVCVWLATSGRTKIGDRKGALDAAMLIWIDVETSTARTEPDSGIKA